MTTRAENRMRGRKQEVREEQSKDEGEKVDAKMVLEGAERDAVTWFLDVSANP